MIPRPRDRHVVASRKDEGALGHAALLVQQPLRTTAPRTASRSVALDSVGAGPGEDVFYVRGREARFPFLPPGAAGGRLPSSASSTPGTWRRRDASDASSATWSATKNAKLEGAKLMLVQPLDLDRRSRRARPCWPCDGVDAGIGDRVTADPGRTLGAAGARQGHGRRGRGHRSAWSTRWSSASGDGRRRIRALDGRGAGGARPRPGARGPPIAGGARGRRSEAAVARLTRHRRRAAPPGRARAHVSLPVLDVPGGGERCVLEPDQPCTNSGTCRSFGH
jgi:microcompartment protein CcmK/EutM